MYSPSRSKRANPYQHIRFPIGEGSDFRVRGWMAEPQAQPRVPVNPKPTWGRALTPKWGCLSRSKRANPYQHVRFSIGEGSDFRVRGWMAEPQAQPRVPVNPKPTWGRALTPKWGCLSRSKRANPY